MGNRHLYKIECLHMLGTPGSGQLKVTAPNLFYPTASPLFQNVGFLYCDTATGEGGGDGLNLWVFGNWDLFGI